MTNKESSLNILTKISIIICMLSIASVIFYLFVLKPAREKLHKEKIERYVECVRDLVKNAPLTESWTYDDDSPTVRCCKKVGLPITKEILRIGADVAIEEIEKKQKTLETLKELLTEREKLQKQMEKR